MPLTDQGVLKFLPRKTLVEFPQKVAPPFRKQGSDSEGTQQGRKGTDDSSSSSSSSSSSDSESDEEGDSSEAGPQAKSKLRGGFPVAQASHSSAGGAPQIEISAQEKSVSQQPHPDLVSAQRTPGAKKKGASRQPSEDRKDPKPKTTAPKSHAGGKFMEQDVKEKQWQEVSTSNEIDKESQKPLEVKTLSDRAKSGLSTRPHGSPAPTQSAETRAGRRLPATPETTERLLEKQVPEPDGEVALSLFQKENLEKQVAEGILKAKEEILEDQLPVKNLKPVPVHNKDVFDEKTAVLKLEEKGGIIEDSATQMEGQDGTQESPLAATPAEPFDNTTYKNLQHHDYSTYTFLDLNLELLKFRMPQPSSGRESPRH
ncbi:NADH dehydrogenase [ubiquinone] flavoprotein 3, mitochondrial isoform X2 [Orcinus orca]|nr:NADH dehydrogenase [ubiquinone] flavoprotein 3, mitochondrial isoform X2 [Orcinus orca]